MRANKELLEKKWRKFLRLRKFFSYIPFVDFVFVSGSLALGKPHEFSDFDVIVGAKKGRIFTVRMLTICVFSVLGARRGRLESGKEVSDKICLNHFVTPKSYRLSPPYNDYWREVYPRLVPVFGDEAKIDEFFSANTDWAGNRKSGNDMLMVKKFNFIRIFLDILLRGFLGDFFEAIFKKIQVLKIETNKDVHSKGRGPRIYVGDDELAFHHY